MTDDDDDDDHDDDDMLVYKVSGGDRVAVLGVSLGARSLHQESERGARACAGGAAHVRRARAQPSLADNSQFCTSVQQKCTAKVYSTSVQPSLADNTQFCTPVQHKCTAESC